MTDNDALLTGKWHFQYWYPSNHQVGAEEISAYAGTFQKNGNYYIYESQPNEEGAYMFVRMTIDGDLATGTWHESTSPTGEFEGSQYSGAFQALISKTHDTINGKWAGIGQEEGKRQIYTGHLLFKRAD